MLVCPARYTSRPTTTMLISASTTQAVRACDPKKRPRGSLPGLSTMRMELKTETAPRTARSGASSRKPTTAQRPNDRNATVSREQVAHRFDDLSGRIRKRQNAAAWATPGTVGAGASADLALRAPRCLPRVPNHPFALVTGLAVRANRSSTRSRGTAKTGNLWQ